MLFLDRLHAHCAHQPEKVAIEFVDDQFMGHTAVTYGVLEQMVDRTTAMLAAQGVRRNDRVAIQLPKCLPFVYLHLAVMRLGAISLPLNPGYPARELAYFLADAEAKLFFADAAANPALVPLLAEQPWLQACHFVDAHDDRSFDALLCETAVGDGDIAAACAPDDTCLMIYTSGTTGRPKGAELTHGNLTANLDSLHGAWDWQADDILLHVLPIFHVHGLVVALHGALHAGATTIMHGRFDAFRTLGTLVQRRCTVFMAVPTIYRRLVDAPNAHQVDLSHMRLLTSGSDRLPDDLFFQFHETFGHTLVERYGMSETIMLTSNPLHGDRRVGSVGMPLPGVEVRISDPEQDTPLANDTVGEVQVRGANVCKGYWRQPDKTAAAFTVDGWFRTGDLGQRGADGYLTLKGRSKDLIISGGLNVYPPEIELVLADHPAISASAVVGCPDVEWGERVTAIVLLHTGVEATEQELITYCRERLAPYKAPRRIIFVKELPRNAMGKVQKAQLRLELCA